MVGNASNQIGIQIVLVVLVCTAELSAIDHIALRDRPLTQTDLPTTAGAIYFINLNNRIHALEKITAGSAAESHARMELSSSLYLRGRIRNDLDDVQRAIDELSECLRADPTNLRALVMRAKQHLSMHCYSAASSDLATSHMFADEYYARDALQAELLWNLGDYDGAVALIDAVALSNPGMETIARLAKVQQEKGNFGEADRLFQAAEDLVIDTNPFPVAWLNAQRARLYMDRGQAKQAELFYREAIERMPEYLVAREGLAEVLSAQGRYHSAISVLQGVSSTNRNPEMLSLLASLHDAIGRKEQANTLVAEARRIFERQLQQYPEATYWHAAEFYMQREGEAATAVELLSRNVALRPNSESWFALARAQFAIGDIAGARESLTNVLSKAVRPIELDRLLQLREFCDLAQRPGG